MVTRWRCEVRPEREAESLRKGSLIRTLPAIDYFLLVPVPFAPVTFCFLISSRYRASRSE